MGTNVEIKARIDDFDAHMRTAMALADGPAGLLEQEDTYFHVPNGRLKLRELGDGTGELIEYRRVDVTGPGKSTYVRSHTSEPASLRQALSNALGIRAVVRKTRRFVLMGQTRIHLGTVAGLGHFIELEVVLRPRQTAAEGSAMAQALMTRLGIEQNQLLSEGYLDLVEREAATPAPVA